MTTMSNQLVSSVFFSVAGTREPRFAELVTNHNQVIIVTVNGVPKSIIRPFEGDEEQRFLDDMDLFTVSLRDLRHSFHRICSSIQKNGSGQAAITRVPISKRSVEELLKVITVLTDDQSAQLIDKIHLDKGLIEEFTRFRQLSLK